MWATWTCVGFGIWLAASPFIVGTTMLGHDLFVGGSIFLLGYLGSLGLRWANWTNVAFGLWVTLAPFMFDTTGVSTLNYLAVGPAVTLLAWRASVLSPDPEDLF